MNRPYDNFMSEYSRLSPSPRYRELLSLYRQIHVEGDSENEIPPERIFVGQSLLPHGGTIKQIIDHNGAKTILDYGSGKGLQYGEIPITLADGRSFNSFQQFWGVEKITCYDPCCSSHDTLPSGRFDGVICTDVLEHCPEEDLPWILAEIFGYADDFVFITAALYPATKNLPNGENAHCTLKSPAWWKELIKPIADSFTSVRYRLELLPCALGNDDSKQEPREIFEELAIR